MVYLNRKVAYIDYLSVSLLRWQQPVIVKFCVSFESDALFFYMHKLDHSERVREREDVYSEAEKISLELIHPIFHSLPFQPILLFVSEPHPLPLSVSRCVCVCVHL